MGFVLRLYNFKGAYLPFWKRCSQDEEDRRFAVKQIREIGERLNEPEIGDESFRERIPPKLNFEATTLQKLIDWDTCSQKRF